jgi:hypothetical protein
MFDNPQFIDDKVLFHNTCPNCRENYPRRFDENWPKLGFRHCGTCGKHFKKEKFQLTAKLVPHPSKVPSVCPDCGSIHIDKETQKYDHDFMFFRIECFSCHRLFWFASKKHRTMRRTAKIAESKRAMGSYREYRGRHLESVLSPMRNHTGKSNENNDVVIPISKLVRQKFIQTYKREPQSVGYTKNERSDCRFEKTLSHHPAVRIFENYKVVYEDILSTAHKLARINKRGKLWDYLLLAVIHIVLFQQNKKDFMPNLPYFWKKIKTSSFHWKTYQKHLLFAIANTQPFIKNDQLLAKKPEAWLQQMIPWYENIPHPNKSATLIQNLTNAVSLDAIKKNLHQPSA